MVELRQLLVKILQSIPIVTTGTPTFTATTGSVTSATYYKFGHLVCMHIQVKTGTSDVAGGSNLFAGKLTGPYLPYSVASMGFTYSGKLPIGTLILTDGTMTVRNCSATTFLKNSSIYVSCIFLTE